MFTLDIRQTRTKKAMIVYTIITLLCIIFTLIYESQSYGQYSRHMRLMFLFPLISAVINVICYRMKIKISRLTFNLYNSAIAIFVIGCIVSGIITISGRTSIYDMYYWMIGGVYLIGALLSFIYQCMND